MPATLTFALTVMLVIVSALVSSMAGFGFGVTAMPFMLLMYPPKTAIPLTIVTVGVWGIFQWVNVRREANYRLALLLVGGAVVGIPLGGLVLAAISPSHLKGLVGVSILTALLAHGFLRREVTSVRVPGPWLVAATGFMAGLMSTSAGQPGIPVALMMSWTGLNKAVMRGTLVTFLMLTQLTASASLMLQGILTPKTLWTGLGLVPFCLIGMVLGNLWFRHLSQAMHRRLVFGVLTVSAATAVFNGVISLHG